MPVRVKISSESLGLRRRDWLLITFVVVLQAIAPRAGSEVAADQPGWVGAAALVTAGGQGTALAWRRRLPEASAIAVLALYAVSVALVGLIPPLAAWVVIWTLAVSLGDRPRALRATGLAALTTVAILVVGELSRAGSSASLPLAAITIVVCLSAVLLRSERGRLDAIRQASAAEERLRIAADLHDLVGHGLSAIAVQSSTARLALAAGDSSAASTALSAVEGSSRSAMREMRQLLGVLSTDERAQGTPSTDAPAPGLADIPALVANMQAGGVAVTWHSEVDSPTVSGSVQLCAYRVVQEALTNAVKHAPGAMVSVILDEDREADRGGQLRLRVATIDAATSRGGTAREETGHDDADGGAGIAGIHARVASVGGTAFVGLTDTGWLVEARLPISVEGRP